jgi:hypothetical protein
MRSRTLLKMAACRLIDGLIDGWHLTIDVWLKYVPLGWRGGALAL